MWSCREERDRERSREMSTTQSFLRCCGSVRFASDMARVAPFSSLDSAVEAAREIWWNKVLFMAFLD